MKVLFISNDPSIFDKTSATRARMYTYAATMESLYIVSAAPPQAQEEHDGNLFLYPVHTSKLFRVRALASRAHAIISTQSIDVVSAQDPFEQGLAALRAVRGTSAKLHIQIHTDFLSPWFVRCGGWRIRLLNRMRRHIADRVLPRANGIRAVSERIKASIVARYGATIPEPSVIPVVMSAEPPPSVPLPSHHFTFALIAVGRLEPEKCIEDVFAALAHIKKQYPMVGLFIIGAGHEKLKLQKRAEELGLSEHVIFVDGWLPADKAWGMMKSAQAFIQASAYEGAQRTLIEAALANVPIITTDVGIVGDMLIKDESALVCPVGDTECLAQAIIKLVEDNDLRRHLRENAEQSVRAHLAAIGNSATRITEDLERVLKTS